MFTNVSMAGTGGLILVIEALLRYLGVELPENLLSESIKGLMVFLGTVLLVVGQLRRPDLKWGFIRK